MHHLYEISFVLYTRHFRFKDDDVLTKNLGEMVNLILSIKQNQIMNLNFRARNFGILEYGSTAVISRLNWYRFFWSKLVHLRLILRQILWIWVWFQFDSFFRFFFRFKLNWFFSNRKHYSIKFIWKLIWAYNFPALNRTANINHKRDFNHLLQIIQWRL